MTKKDKKCLIISIAVNILISFWVLLSLIFMYTGFKFMKGSNIILEVSKSEMFKFFTVESNVFMGIIALIFAIQEIKVLKGKTKSISTSLYILKLIATTAVGLTFFVVFTYLGPLTTYGIKALIMNSNLFFHLIIPVLSMLNFVLFEKTSKIKFRQVIYGIIPTVLYSFYYTSNIIIHMENGRVSSTYDWYWLVQNGVWTAVIVVPIMFGISYVISLVLWKLNRKKEEG